MSEYRCTKCESNSLDHLQGCKERKNMKTYTERRIELGQDLNNAWTMLGAHISAYPDRYGAINTVGELKKAFEEFHAKVKMVNDEKRQQLQDTIDYETAHARLG